MAETGLAGSEYDVFLSFRGPDCRLGITDVLYEFMTDKGIRVFRDDEEIRRGEEIGGELERAILGSRVCVVVFSRNYATSTWCLQELAMMVDCRRDSASGKVILPIFFDVDPYDVKLRTDLYRSALDIHKGRYGEEGVKRWEEALETVGRISGWDYKVNQGLGKFVRLVVKDVLSNLKIRERRLPHHLIGMDNRVDSVLNMLNCDSPEVRIVMVHGMGGIGKTTLANFIFNKISSQFDESSFLANVRESSTGEEGAAKLQNALLDDILGGRVAQIRDSSNGMIQINTRLKGKRVLIILDDVSEISQLDKLVGNCDFFGLGTRIIITTRNKSICKGLTRPPPTVCTYEMEEMSDDHALQLFSWHAFDAEGPPDDFAALSKQVVRTTGNLPLALQVIGGHLLGESKDVWDDILQKLKRAPHKDVNKILRISYDGLEETEKQIFLDIACFSCDTMPRKYASYMWEACDFYPKSGVAVLLNKSLVKVLPNNDEFGMHDLIREMGRDIVRTEGLHSLGMRSRLWNPYAALDVVCKMEGTNRVSAMKLSCGDKGGFTCEGFEGMSNLRFLHLDCGSFIGDFRNFRTKLMWLHWPIGGSDQLHPSFFHMNNLVVLKISGSGVTDKLTKDLRMGNLRVLHINNAAITRMPDLSRCLKLEIIVLERCDKLEALHSSVGLLWDLKSLDIVYCNSLRSLQEELGCAKALQELNLNVCPHIRELPESIGNLKDLRVLRARFTNLWKLPPWIGNLESLEVLELDENPTDDEFVQKIMALSSLEEQNLDGCNLYRLPGSISRLSHLRSLILSGVHMLRELPELPSSLTKLIVGSCSLQLLPDLSALTNLTELVLDLDRYVIGFRGSQRQPLRLLGIGKLHRLQRLKLHLRKSPVPVLLSAELGSLSCLEVLDVNSEDISSLSQLPSCLRELRITPFRTEVQWEHYSNLGLLHTLDLSCSMLTEIQLGGLDKLGNLRFLKIKYCSNLEKLDLTFMRRLKSLHLILCPRLVDISGIERMELLEELIISGGCNSLLLEIPDLLELTRLKRVKISSCPKLIRVPSMIGECCLDVGHCDKLESYEGPYRQYHHRQRNLDLEDDDYLWIM